MIALVLPGALIAILFVDGSRLKDEGFLERFGQLYSNMNYQRRAHELWPRLYFLIFVLRRTILISIGFFLTQNQIYQILIVIYMQLMVLVYQGIVSPGPDRASNRFDLFNEMQIMICTQFIILFTDWVDPTIQIQMGWYWVGVLLFTVFANLIFIFYLSFRSVKLLLKKIFLRVKNWLMKKYREYKLYRAEVLNRKPSLEQSSSSLDSSQQESSNDSAESSPAESSQETNQ